MKLAQTNLRDKVHELAEEAFHRKLISGYGDGQNRNEYQIVWNGKPRHLPLERACTVEQFDRAIALTGDRTNLGLTLISPISTSNKRRISE